jgi:signal transduction histidine kinase
LYGIPLVHRGDLVGVALMGSTTAYDFSEEDKLLFRTMAGRATAIIVQGQLLEREQAARTEAERLAKALEASLDLRDHVMGVLSHDLRNPLGVIKVSTSVLLKRADLPEAEAPVLTRISWNAERIERMIHDLLDYTRARGTGIPVSPQPANLFDLCKQIIDSMEQLHPNRRFKLEVDGDTQGEWDRERVLQVVSNLLSNAVKFSNEGTPITVTLKGIDDRVELAVHNEGAPIPAEKLGHVFEPFMRGANSAAAREQGLGLGLFIVDQIVRSHHGTVEVCSDAEHGTTFSVRWPRR